MRPFLRSRLSFTELVYSYCEVLGRKKSKKKELAESSDHWLKTRDAVNSLAVCDTFCAATANHICGEGAVHVRITVVGTWWVL